ncbi:D-alanyl-lipoteichoic acid acyltransferase DltB, MBOAT superfamily [Granulicella rosea]|uniref:D-alanyl-lipoteichoic acid acyltransferase DltB, MBOAT superfamily n=1 Tax=Granulicella rosea TaxID=474952 RepID=A0A239M3J2_9BACT|nr:MBOAT family O-acyltransferase [Granulicella rosea]SNT37226.1 D-alanyl-lipoteichoic acid acyltransferase DltB, MBOAT superfamily [Granulicella rosea]
MLLSTPAFFVFYLLVWLLYWALAGQRSARPILLVVANLFFLAKFGALYLLLPAAATVDYLAGLALAREGATTQRRALVGLSLAVNVGLLAGMKLLPLAVGDRFAWLLTLSLSFYCFQSLTYTIDLYRRDEDARAEPNYLAYLSAALFFPVMVAGPILRMHAFLKQLAQRPELTPELAGRALLLIGIGLVKKLLIADYLSENLVTRVFDTPTLYSGLEVLAAVYGYAMQLFFDFSGYTDIALGVGLLLGLTLPENFNRPYLAANLADFWRRWHMSFSFWLRDYIQEPLSQRTRRKHPLKTYCFSVIATMLLGGLWHGIGWTFLVWGALHGVALATVQLWKSWRKKAKKKATIAGTIFATLLTFHFVCFTWIFFHAASMANAWEILGRIGSMSFTHDNLTLPILGVLALAAVLHCLPLRLLDGGATLLGRMPFWVQGLALAGLVLAIQTISGKGSATFIYGNF